MAARKKAVKAGAAAIAARKNPYVQRLIEDDDLRENLREALDRTRKAYGRLSNGKAPAKALMEDRKLQRELRDAATSLRDVGQALKQGPKRKRGGGLGRKLFALTLAGGLALVFSEGLRKKVLDALFGSEEEFEYQSTTAPATPATQPEKETETANA
jgi:hypothetical protein